MSDAPQYIREPTVVENGYVQPVAAQPVIGQPMVAQPVIVAAAPSVAQRTSYTRRFAPDAIVATVAGLFVTLVGLLAVTRGGFAGPMDTPVVSVLGFTHTTLLGLFEAGIGICLLVSGATRSRTGALFFGSVLGIGAFVGAVQKKTFVRTLALESGLAWLMVVIAVVVVVSAVLLPRFQTRTTTVGSL